MSSSCARAWLARQRRRVRPPRRTSSPASLTGQGHRAPPSLASTQQLARYIYDISLPCQRIVRNVRFMTTKISYPYVVQNILYFPFCPRNAFNEELISEIFLKKICIFIIKNIKNKSVQKIIFSLMWRKIILLFRTQKHSWCNSD